LIVIGATFPYMMLLIMFLRKLFEAFCTFNLQKIFEKFTQFLTKKEFVNVGLLLHNGTISFNY